MAEPATDELIAEIEAAEEIGGIVNEHFLQTLEHLIERREGPFWQSAETFKALIARIREQEATIKRMDDALKPFAELADRYDPPDGDDDDMAWEATACPTVGQLRAARAARKEPT